MSDNITLPRELVKHLKWVLEEVLLHGDCTERPAIEALRAALAAPDDIEALRRDAERYRWLLDWLVETALLTAQRCRIDAPETYGDWYILRKPYVIDGSVLVGYGKTEDAAIDAAMEDKT